jgi:hypothetical protein
VARLVGSREWWLLTVGSLVVVLALVGWPGRATAADDDDRRASKRRSMFAACCTSAVVGPVFLQNKRRAKAI